MPVGVRHIQMVGAQAAQAVLYILDDALGGQVPVNGDTIHDLVQHRGLMPPLQPAFGGQDRLVPANAAQCLAHHSFAVAQAVDGGGVDSLHAGIHGSFNGLDGHFVVVVPPPAASADGPGAHPRKGT